MDNRTLNVTVAGTESMFCTLYERVELVFGLGTSAGFDGSFVIDTMATRGLKNGVSNTFSKWFP